MATAMALGLCGQLALAEGTQPHRQEAEQFFSQLVRDSKNPLITSFARQNLDQLKDNTARRRYEVPLLTHNTNSLAVPVMANGKIMGTFLVDTGATYTVITPRMARKLGVQITADTPRQSIITANGMIKAPVVRLKSLTIGGLTQTDVDVIVQNLGNDLLLSGLLGMNAFEGMDLSIRPDKLVLETSR